MTPRQAKPKQVCYPANGPEGVAGRAYCGRRKTILTNALGSVTCRDCLAARRADANARRRR